jgi:NDP-sugar pyrophosphorylase family protein
MIFEIRTAVVIVGGEGSRLAPLTKDMPKTLVEVSGKPLLYWIIRWLKKYGITHLVLGVSYKKEKIYEYMKENDNFGLEVDISEHTIEGGTAEAFGLAIKRFVKDDAFVAMNGDELTNLNLENMKALYFKYKPIVTMALSPFPCRFSVVKFDSSNTVTSFEYGKKLNAIPISIGVYIFDKKIIDFIPSSGSIENTTFAELINSGKIKGKMISGDEEWISINTPKDVKEAEKIPQTWMQI